MDVMNVDHPKGRSTAQIYFYIVCTGRIAWRLFFRVAMKPTTGNQKKTAA